MSNKKISRLWISLIGILFGISASNAENNLIFESNKIIFNRIEMPYRIAHINGQGDHALIIYLHGGSNKGNDNKKQMSESGIDSIANYLESHNICATFLVPQCPSDKSWGGPMLGVLKSMIDAYVFDEANDNTNPNVFIFGGSMGGTGTWSMLSAYPGLFTAAMPVAGNPSKCDADKVAETPVYTVMGTSDQIMSIETTSDFIEELNTRNADTRFDIEEGWTHEMTCVQSYTTPRLDWIFSHIRSSVGIDNITTATNDEIKVYNLMGHRLDNRPLPSGIYIINGRKTFIHHRVY